MVRFELVRERTRIEELLRSKVRGNSIPDLYVMEYDDSLQMKIPAKFKAGKYTYKLDASVVMDTQGEHFCSTLTCGGKEMGFDGGSFSRLESFKWKSMLNKNKDWTFEGSIFDHDEKDKVWWNYHKSYKILFYYRT